MQLMKKTILLIVLTGFLMSAYSQESKPKKSDATVEQVQGMYVFVDAMPKAEYDFLGTISAGSGFGKVMVSAAEYEPKKNRLIKNAKEKYPQADGLIIHFNRGGKDTADAIKFKD
jgi:hypothetical protein